MDGAVGAGRELVEDARRATIERGRRTAAQDALVSGLIGLATALWLHPMLPLVAAGVVVAVLALVLDVWQTRRRGVRAHRVLDERAVGRSFATYLVVWLPIFLVTAFKDAIAGDPLLGALVGLGVAVTGFVYLRLDDRYQTRRLLTQDHGPWDRV